MVVFTPAVTGGFLDLGPSLNKGKEVSSQAMERIKCIVVDMENVTSLAMGEHGEMEKSSSLITLTPMMGWLRQMISPNLGVGPFLQNNKTSTYTPTSMVTKSPSSGPRLITNDIGQGLEIMDRMLKNEVCDARHFLDTGSKRLEGMSLVDIELIDGKIEIDQKLAGVVT
ncbi:hypothetical protein QYF36_009366 [Acer negundo]|nr:hypothetical protein QYF36_009366 [Acer negundo]